MANTLIIPAIAIDLGILGNRFWQIQAYLMSMIRDWRLTDCL